MSTRRMAHDGEMLGVQPKLGSMAQQISGSLRGIVIVTGGSGPLAGAFGGGPCALNWNAGLSGPFDATLLGALTVFSPPQAPLL